MKRFKLIITKTDDGFINVESENEGFEALEIAGALELKKLDIYNQLEAETNHRRTCVVGGKTYSVVESEDTE